MRRTFASHPRRLPVAVSALTVLCLLPTPAIPSSPAQQAAAFADLMVGIATCAIAPCIGTEVEELDSLLRGQFALDGDYYADFDIAYPRFAHMLDGVVIFEADGAIYGLLFILAGLHAPPGFIISELEALQFECEEDEDSEAGQQEWDCWRTDDDDGEFEPYLVIGNGAMMVEL